MAVPIPKQIGGLFIWLDSANTDTISDTAGSVTQWDDKSAYQYHFTQGTGANQPTTNSVTIAGKNAIDFDGTDDFVEIDNAAIRTLLSKNNDQTIFVILQSDVTSSTDVFISSNISTNDRFSANIETGVVEAGYYDGTVFESSQSEVFTDTSGPHLITYTHDGTADSLVGRLDGTTMTGAGTPSTDATVKTTVGARSSGSVPFDGKILEVIGYEGQLSTANRDKLEAYLGQKWGIAVA